MSGGFERPNGRPTFTEPWFLWFFEQLVLPEGHPVRWAGHLRLMTREFFRPEVVHLLVMLPKGNWKTTWEAALADWHLLTVEAPRVYAGAADKEQAKELYQFAASFIENDPELPDYLSVRESTLEIRTRQQRGLFKILASDDSKQGGKKQGKNGTLNLGDELHAWENDNLFVDLRSGGFKRREAAKLAGDPLWWTLGKMGTITTAGWDQNGVLGLERAKALAFDQHGGTVERGLRVLDDGSVEPHPDGRLTICRSASGGTVMVEWAVRDDDDISDYEVVKFVNPAPTVTISSLQDAHESLSPWHYARYRTNRWTLTYESWLPDGSWESLRDGRVPAVEHRTWEKASGPELQAYVRSLYPEGTRVVGFIDMARYRDCAALVLIGTVDGLRIPRAIIWRSGGQDNPIPYAPTLDAWRWIDGFYGLAAAGYDPKYYDQAAEELEDDGLPMEQWPQSNERMCPAAANLRHAILTDKSFAHDGDPILSAHIMAAVAKDVGTDQFKLVKSSGNGPPIDACVALACANELDGIDNRSMYDDDDAII